MIERAALSWTLALAAALLSEAAGQMPREDVVDVPAYGEGLCVSNLFQSNMVVQRDAPIAVWGRAAAGEEVTVVFGDGEAVATADGEGRWRATLPALPASRASRRMTIRGAERELTLDDVLVGDVWVLGGQSNMEFELAKVENGDLEIASANLPEIRILTVPYAEGIERRESFPRLYEWSDWFGRHFRKGDWDVCSPRVARELSAIGFAFARRVHLVSGVPIGVIDASRGGTTVETWTPREALAGLGTPAVREKLADWSDRVAAWDPRADLEQRVQQHRSRVARLSGEGKPIPANLSEEPSDLRPGPALDHNRPGAMFASMIGPLVGLRVKGVVFHQGYNNALDGMRGVRLYQEAFPCMIREWRAAFGDPELPFGILSLCTDGDPQTRDNAVERMLNAGVHVRAVQYRTFLDLLDAGDRNVGFASCYDLRRRWYHPQVKLPAGERLARWALATQYGHGRALRWVPPRLIEMEPTDGALVLRLDTDVSDPEDGAIEGFLIAGEDRRFQPATVAYVQVGEDDRGRPRFDRKQLSLSSPLVEAPVHFRYGWARNPLANLQATGNKDLPFATQRSDDWDMGTVPLGVLDEPIDGRLTRPQRGHVLRALRGEDERRRLAVARALLEAAGATVSGPTK